MSPTAAAKTLLIAALFGAGLSGAALARDNVFTAKLVTPVSEPARVIAQNTVWSCEGDTCVAAARHEATVRACRQFVREAGPVSAYGAGDRQLNADELARCNGAQSLTQEARN